MSNYLPKDVNLMREIGGLNKGTPKRMTYEEKVLKAVKAARTRSGVSSSWSPEHEAAWMDGFRRGLGHALKWPRKRTDVYPRKLLRERIRQLVESTSQVANGWFVYP